MTNNRYIDVRCSTGQSQRKRSPLLFGDTGGRTVQGCLQEAPSEPSDQPSHGRGDAESRCVVEHGLPLQAAILKNILTYVMFVDRILPESWMWPIYKSQWQTLLRVDQGIDQGPGDTLDPAVFDKHCLRCGRTLNNGGKETKWVYLVT